MDSTSEKIGNVVALLTAILSEQEEIAYELVLESNPIELFSALTGILLSALGRLSTMSGITPEKYLKELGLLAARSE